ncbi:hypothetical protein [Cupriavidus sp. amp6]|uniref:hypothetical protein n=1 Tax=Cupriavidus sp. amp6 TaxID=388051 RepID=UPI001E4B4BC1|nr:hypothetical protein [Cupriavidus sp. amp6]
MDVNPPVPRAVEFPGPISTNCLYVRTIRLLLLILMLAFLPLQGWANAVAHTVSADATAKAAEAEFAERDDAGHPMPPSEAAEPSEQTGSDPVEQLLSPSPLVLAACAGSASRPQYAGGPLPGPDLPRLPRPPRG